MQKFRQIHMAKMIGFSALLSFGIVSHGIAATTTKSTSGHLSSSQVFQGLMNDPFLNQAYQSAQGAFLRTSPDQRLAAFFDTNPILQSPDVQEKLNAVMLQGVKDSINMGLASMKRVTPLTNPTLYNRFVLVMHRLGYSDEDIKSATFFRAQGSINAYVTSPFHQKIVLVLFDGLDNVMDERQEESVLGHELGHVLSRHVLRGAEHVAMTLQLGNLYAKNGNFGGFSDLNKLKSYEFYRHELEPYQQVFWDRIFSLYDLNSNSASPVVNEVKAVQRARFVDAMEVIHDAVKSQPDLGRMAVSGYLKAMVDSLSEMDVPQNTVQYYADLLNTLPRAANDQKDAQQFAEFMMEGIANAGSKALESSADRYGQVATDAYRAATTDLIFKGANVDPESAGRPDLTRLQLIDLNMQEVVDEWLIQHQINTPEEYVEFFGRDPSVDHPYPIKRIIDMLVAARSVGTIGLSNPFLKNVILYDQLIKQSFYVQQELDQITAGLKSDEAKKMTVEQQRMVSKQIKELQAYQKQSQDGAADVAKVIMGLISDPALTVNNPKADGKTQYNNPRLMDFLDFELALQQTQSTVYAQVLKEATSPDDKKQIQEALTEKAQLRNTPLLAAVKDYLAHGDAHKNLGSDRIAELLTDVKLLGKSDATFQDIQTARSTIAQETKSENRKDRIPSDLTVRLQSTGTVKPETTPTARTSSSKSKTASKKDDSANSKENMTDNSAQPQKTDADLAAHFQHCELVMQGF